MPRPDPKRTPKQYAFTGELVMGEDPLKIGEENFSVLENFRYVPTGIEGVLGYSKINSIPLSYKTYPGYYRGRSGIQLRSQYSGEGRILVQCEWPDLSASAIMEHMTAVPGTGEFESDVVWPDDFSGGLGRFARWPGGHVAYANGEELLVYAGGEIPVAGFINYAPDDDFRYDYSEVVSNTEWDNENIATLKRVAESLDADTVALYHFDNDATDETGDHDATAQGTMAYSSASSGKKFGTHGAQLNGTDAYFTIVDHADFDFSGGTWTLDWQGSLDALPGSGKHFTLWWQETAGTGNDWIHAYIDENGAVCLQIKADHGGAPALDVDIASPNGAISAGGWQHVEIGESGDSWYILVDGVLQLEATDAGRAADYTGTIYVGYDGASGAGYYYDGYLDELRVSTACRHTGDFEVPVAAYGTASYRSYCYVGCTRPVQGFKFYMQTDNRTPGDLNVEYWNGTAWAGVGSLDTSGVESPAGTPLGQTGSVTFTSTVGDAEVRAIDSMVLYWYRVTITECDNTCQVYHVTMDAPMQEILDLWDGVYRTAIKCLVYDSSAYNDYTTNVAAEDYSSVNTATYCPLDALGTSDYALLGFQERQLGINVKIVGGKVNANAAVLTVSYWDGDDWQSVGAITDGTSESAKSFARSGTVSWHPPGANVEFPRSIENEPPLYYYKLSFSAALSANVYVDYIGGITAPRKIVHGWKFPFMFQNRPMMCGFLTGKEPHRVDYGARNTTEVFNGEDSSEGLGGSLYFGASAEELTAACAIYNRFGSQIYSTAVFCKKNETFLLDGYDQETWRIYTISTTEGCPAPLTMDTAEVGFGMASEARRNIGIWMTYTGVVVFDAAVMVPVDWQIRNFFDDTKDECINRAAIDKAFGWVDPNYREYNLLIPTGTSTVCDRWLCLDLARQRWFEKVPVIEAGASYNAYPQAAFRVQDADGTTYCYGMRDDGYMLRMEHGPTWAGEDMTFKVRTADHVPEMWHITQLEKVQVILTPVTEADAVVAVTHYRNGESTGQSLGSITPTGSNRHMIDMQRADREGKAWSHAMEFEATTDETLKGVPLLGWGCIYTQDRELGSKDGW